MPQFGFCGGSYTSESPNASDTATINWYPETTEDPAGVSPVVMYPSPGITPFVTLTGSSVRGELEFNGRAFAVTDRFYEIFDNGNGTGRATAYSFLPVDDNPVSLEANNNNQLIICSGGQLWLFPLAPGSIVYHNVPTAITNIQIVDGVTNQNYFVTCAKTPPYNVGTTIDFDTIGTLSLLDNLTAPITDIVADVIHVQFPRTLTAAYPQNIASIVVTSGPIGPTETTAGAGAAPGLDWTNPNNITGDTSYATFSVITGGAGNSGPLVASLFAQAVPTDATILGIQQTFTRKQSQAGHNIAKTGAVYLYKGGVPVGTPKIGTSYYVNSDVVETWGGPTDLWGTTWTNNDINDPGFGGSMNVAYDETELSDTVSVKNYKIEIWWVVATSTIDLTFVSTVTYGVNGVIALNGLTNVPQLDGNSYRIASIAGSTVTIGPIPNIGSTYSGVETGQATGQLVTYNAADTGNVKGDVVSITDNPVQVAIGQGPFSNIQFLDGYFIALISNSQTFQISDLEDGTTWNPINKYQVSVFAENTPGMIVNQRELWLFGNKRSVVYSTTPDPLVPFQPISGAFMEEGIDAPNSLSRLDNSIFWLAKNELGHVIARRASGWTPIRISSHAVENAWRSYGTTSDAVGYAWQMNGHIFWQLWFPTADKTWVYDAATNQWHERTFLPFAGPSAQAHRSRSYMFAFNRMLVGDRSSGTIYTQVVPVTGTPSYDFVDGQFCSIQRIRRAPHISNEQEWTFHTQLQVYLESGLANISGPGNSPIISLRFSDDGGHTWSNSHFASAGMIGQYRTRCMFRRLGRSRDRVYELTCTDPIPWRIVDAYLKISKYAKTL